MGRAHNLALLRRIGGIREEIPWPAVQIGACDRMRSFDPLVVHNFLFHHFFLFLLRRRLGGAYHQTQGKRESQTGHD